MTDHELTALFAQADTEAEPALGAGFTEQTVTLARRSVRRRRLAGALVVTVAVVVAGTVPVLLTAPAPLGPAAPAGHASLPDQFAGYSMLTTTVTRQPAGRAIAMYTNGSNEILATWQPLVVGADRDTYRQVDPIIARSPGEGNYPEALLAPDGTRVLVGDGRGTASSLELVDLGTGQRRELRVDPPAWVRLLAWSPDGRYVAYSTAPLVHPAGYAITTATLATSELVLLDLDTGTSTHYPRLRPVRSASFAPDSRRLAVQLDQQAWIVTLDGQPERQLTLPPGRELLMRYAWLPDGELIATVPLAEDITYGTYGGALVFVDATGASHPVPAPIEVVDVLGWRSPTRLLAFDTGYLGLGGNIVEVDLDTGQRRVLSRFSDATDCEYGLHACQVADLQLATGLLATLDTRTAGDPDRGAWPSWLILTCAGLAATLAALVGWTVRTLRRRRRRRLVVR